LREGRRKKIKKEIRKKIYHRDTETQRRNEEKEKKRIKASSRRKPGSIWPTSGWLINGSRISPG